MHRGRLGPDARLAVHPGRKPAAGLPGGRRHPARRGPGPPEPRPAPAGRHRPVAVPEPEGQAVPALPHAGHALHDPDGAPGGQWRHRARLPEEPRAGPQRRHRGEPGAGPARRTVRAVGVRGLVRPLPLPHAVATVPLGLELVRQPGSGADGPRLDRALRTRRRRRTHQTPGQPDLLPRLGLRRDSPGRAPAVSRRSPAWTPPANDGRCTPRGCGGRPPRDRGWVGSSGSSYQGSMVFPPRASRPCGVSHSSASRAARDDPATG